MSTPDVDLDRLAAAAPSRVARVISTVFTPSLTVLATCGYVALRYDTPAQAVGWWLITLLLVVLAPYAVLFRAVRAGRVDDHHVVRRAQRLGLFVLAAGCVAAALALLIILGAPRPYLALLASMLAGLAVMIMIVRFGKPSVHVSVATGSVVVLAIEQTELAVLALLLIPIGWARVREGRHSRRQVIMGVLIGALVTGPAYGALR